MKKFFLLASVALSIISCDNPILKDIVLKDIGEYDFRYDGIYYNIVSQSQRTVEVAGLYDRQRLSVTIPSSMIRPFNGKEYTVVRIGDGAFEYCTNLTSVSIPSSVAYIGSYAFYHCKNLTDITIPNSVTSIAEHHAFCGCTALTSVSIPNSVKSIGYATFSGCSSLVCVTLSNCLTRIEFATFSGCSSLVGVTIPNSVTYIGTSAFEDCISLTSITIPDSVMIIEESAFENCSKLESIVIGKKVTNIGNGAFNNCSHLSSIICKAIVPPSVEYATFGWISRFTPIYVPTEAVDEYKSAYIWSEFNIIGIDL